jgi:arylsulfatase A-like enzyme
MHRFSDRRLKPVLTCASALVALSLSAGGAAESAASNPSTSGSLGRPNIVFIFADDMAFDTIAAHGNREIATPNLDRLAHTGTTFAHTYNMGAWGGAVCVASRTMLNTGRFLWRAHRAPLGELAASKQLWPQLMESAGYDTYFTGKWHIHPQPGKVFGTARHVRGGMPNQTPAGYNRPLGPEDTAWQPWDRERGGFWQGGKHWSEVVADDAESFLTSAASSDNPFFMYVAFNAPHDPRQSPQEYVDRYPPSQLSLPVPFLPEYPYDIGSNRIRDELLAPFPRTEYAVKVNLQEYYALITHMDTQIGRILDALAQSGKQDNTYVVFTADHGLAVGKHGLMGKQNMYDHSMRVPLMIVGPGIEAKQRIDARVYLQDVMPTALAWAGVPKPAEVEFKSLIPLLRGQRDSLYERIYGAYTETQRMVVAGDYKLISYPQIGKLRLYNLRQDPQETNDLAEAPSSEPILQSLAAQLKELQVAMDDPAGY